MMHNDKTLKDARTATPFRHRIHACLMLIILCTCQTGYAQADIVSNLLVNGSFNTDIGGWNLSTADQLSTQWQNTGYSSPGSLLGTQEYGGVDLTGLDLALQCIAVEAGDVYQLRGSVLMRSDVQIEGHFGVHAVWPPEGCYSPIPSTTLGYYGRQMIFPSSLYASGADSWKVGHKRFRVPENVTEMRIAVSVTAYQTLGGTDHFGAFFDDLSFGKVKADLVADIDFGDQDIYVGNEVTFDVTISNKDGLVGNANGVTATVKSDKRLRLVSETCPGDMVNITQGGTGWISWFNVPRIESGSVLSCTITASVEPGNSLQIYPELKVACPDCDLTPSDNEKRVSLNILPRADIKANISAEPFQSIENNLAVLVELENLGTRYWEEPAYIGHPAGATLKSNHCAGAIISEEDATTASFELRVNAGATRSCTLEFEYQTPQDSLTFDLNASSALDYDSSNNIDSVTFRAVSLRVTSPSIDRGDSNPGDGECLTQVGRTGFCTLRGAIEEANALPGFQVVTLPYVAAGYPLKLSGGDQHLTITDTVKIVGETQNDEAPKIFADWADTADHSRIFVIDSPTGPVEIRDLDLLGQNLLVSGNGGVVRINNTDVKMNNVLLKNGGANFRGGALYSNDDLTLNDTFVSDSQAPFGAGIAFEPVSTDKVLTIYRSRVDDNIQTPFSPQSQGGGIWANGGTVRIIRSSIDNNVSTRGGGIALVGGAYSEIENSTFSANEADQAGGGIWASPGIVKIAFSTFAHNSADPSSDTAGEGGGVYASGASTVWVWNSIFSNNEGQADGFYPKGSTCFGAMSSGGHNTFTPSTSFDADCDVNINSGDNNSAQAILAALAPTGYRQVPYHDLIGEGQDIDMASPDCLGIDASLTRDQRGFPRPVDGTQDGTARCDKGAVESNGDLPGLSVECPSQVSVEAGSTTTVSCAITSINGAAGNVYFSCLGAPPSCDFTPEPLVLAADATADVEVVVYGNATEALSTITVDAILSPARGQAYMQVTTTGDLGDDTIMINADITGSGKVVSSPEGLKCTVSCAQSFPLINSPIELTATPAAGWEFSAWTGDCAGAGIMQPDGSSRCTVTSSEDRTVGAVFVEDQTITVSVVISGLGQVTSAPAGIDCPGTCTAEFADSGANITLTANPDLGWYFTGWTGDCSGTGACSLPRNADQSVMAGFSFGPVPSDVIFKDGFE